MGPTWNKSKAFIIRPPKNGRCFLETAMSGFEAMLLKGLLGFIEGLYGVRGPHSGAERILPTVSPIKEAYLWSLPAWSFEACQ